MATSNPAKVPTNSVFEGANASPGNFFGDASCRTPPSQGSSVTAGLSEQYSFKGETPESLGEGRNDANGKPTGPQKGAVNNGGASAKLQWG